MITIYRTGTIYSDVFDVRHTDLSFEEISYLQKSILGKSEFLQIEGCEQEGYDEDYYYDNPDWFGFNCAEMTGICIIDMYDDRHRGDTFSDAFRQLFTDSRQVFQ